MCVGQDSSVGIATRYGLDGPGIESRWVRDLLHPSSGPEAHPASYTWVPGLSREKSGWGVALTTHPIQRRGSRKSRAILLLPFWAFLACSMVNFTSFCNVSNLFPVWSKYFLSTLFSNVCHLCSFILPKIWTISSYRSPKIRKVMNLFKNTNLKFAF